MDAVTYIYWYHPRHPVCTQFPRLAFADDSVSSLVPWCNAPQLIESCMPRRHLGIKMAAKWRKAGRGGLLWSEVITAELWGFQAIGLGIRETNIWGFYLYWIELRLGRHLRVCSVFVQTEIRGEGVSCQFLPAKKILSTVMLVLKF